MTNKLDWIPGLVQISDYGGDWEKYLNALYQFFRIDFIDSKPQFRSTPVNITKHPYSQGKEATFWHIISEGNTEEDRIPDFERCKRVRWPKAIIEHSDDEASIQVWENIRGREKRTLIRIIFSEYDYLIILAWHKTTVLLVTAYLITWESQKRKLQKEYEAFKADAAL